MDEVSTKSHPVLRLGAGFGQHAALVLLVTVAMNLIYALSAYPFGKFSDTMSHTRLLVLGLIVLIAADVVLAINNHWGIVLVGVVLACGLALLIASALAGIVWEEFGARFTFYVGATTCAACAIALVVSKEGQPSRY